MSATRLIQNAMYAVLHADTTLAGLSLTIDAQTGALTTVGVYNDIPQGAPYPQVLFSLATETPWHTFGGASAGIGWKDIIRVHTFSRYAGDKEALQIHERIVTLLNFQALAVSGFGTVICEYEQLRVMVENIDKIKTRHLVSEFCVRVHQ